MAKYFLFQNRINVKFYSCYKKFDKDMYQKTVLLFSNGTYVMEVLLNRFLLVFIIAQNWEDYVKTVRLIMLKSVKDLTFEVLKHFSY